MQRYLVPALAVLAIALAGCTSTSSANDRNGPPECLEIDVSEGTYVQGTVAQDGVRVVGAAVYAHLQEQTVEATTDERGCFLLTLPAPGHWEGEARFAQAAGPFSVDAQANGFHRVAVEIS